MCTGIKVISKEGNIFWGRTQEFDILLDYVGVIVPKDYQMETSHAAFKTTHAYVGVGIKGYEMAIDGVNDAGLCGGSFYFANYNRYIPKDTIEKTGKLPLCGEEFVTWALANCGSVEEVIQRANKEVAICIEDGNLGGSMPQHYVLQDPTGRSIAVEPSIEGGFEIYENPVGTFTNAPKFDWHLVNLQNYVGMNQEIAPNKKLGDLEVFTSGKGNGLFGLPGDFTPHSRFIRATFLNQFSDQVSDDKVIPHIFHVLDSFDIPKGVVITGDNHKVQYTQYTSAYDIAKKEMYLHMYDNRQIQKLSLAAGDGADKPLFFRIEEEQQVANMDAL